MGLRDQKPFPSFSQCQTPDITRGGNPEGYETDGGKEGHRGLVDTHREKYPVLKRGTMYTYLFLLPVTMS